MRSVYLSLSRRQKNSDHGLGIKEKLKEADDFGLRTTDYGLRTGFKGELKSENHIFLVFILSKFNMYQIKFR